VQQQAPLFTPLGHSNGLFKYGGLEVCVTHSKRKIPLSLPKNESDLISSSNAFRFVYTKEKKSMMTVSHRDSV
jgi:hypothetical protein